MTAPRLLNVGCGATYHSAWVNLDGHAVSSAVMEWDVRRGLPFIDRSFDACYSSHALEHLTLADGARFLREMHRVLKPDGTIRLVVPDLELVARDYLRALERALAAAPGAEDDYDWMMIQLLDQSVRRSSGGAMAEFWRNPQRRNVAFVVARAGLEAERVIATSRGQTSPPRRSLMRRIAARTPAQLLTELRRRAARLLVHAIAGRDAANALEEGLFRNSGEIHQWMYDRYSLARALVDAGFSEPQVCAGDRSRIPAFSEYELDVVGGKVRKPDSLFMEAIRLAEPVGSLPRIADRATVAP